MPTSDRRSDRRVLAPAGGRGSERRSACRPRGAGRRHAACACSAWRIERRYIRALTACAVGLDGNGSAGGDSTESPWRARTQAAHEPSQLLPDAPPVRSARRRGPPHAARLHPQHVGALGQQTHEVVLARRIGAPIVGERDDRRQIVSGQQVQPNRPSAAFTGGRTSRNEKRVPSPCTVVTARSAPIASTSLRQIESPSPDPENA